MHEVGDLHLPVEAGDAIGFLLPSGQVDLGLRTRRQPDGAVQWFTEPCGPCHMDGGTGRELLVEATIEPDEDEDSLGDELGKRPTTAWTTSSPKRWKKTSTTTGSTSSRVTRRKSRPRRGFEDFGSATSIVRETATCSYKSTRPDTDGWAESSRPPPAVRDLGVPRRIGVGQGRANRSNRVRLRLRLSPAGRRMVHRPGRQRARIVVYHLSRSGIKVTMRQIPALARKLHHGQP